MIYRLTRLSSNLTFQHLGFSVIKRFPRKVTIDLGLAAHIRTNPLATRVRQFLNCKNQGDKFLQEVYWSLHSGLINQLSEFVARDEYVMPFHEANFTLSVISEMII